VRDPRVNAHDNSRFLDMLEAYFAQPHEVKLADVHSELCYQVRVVRLRSKGGSVQRARVGAEVVLFLHHQVGTTPEFVETPRCTVRFDRGSALATAPDACSKRLSGGPRNRTRAGGAAGGASRDHAERTRPQVALFLARWAATGRRQHAV
jgi:hypothetical protein